MRGGGKGRRGGLRGHDPGWAVSETSRPLGLTRGPIRGLIKGQITGTTTDQMVPAGH